MCQKEKIKKKGKLSASLDKFANVEEGKTSLTFVPNGVQFSNKKIFCVGRDRKQKLMLLSIKKQHVSTVFSSNFKTAVKARHIEVERVASGTQKSPYLLTAQASEKSTIELLPSCEVPPLTIILSADKLKHKSAVQIQYLHIGQRGVVTAQWKAKKAISGEQQLYCHFAEGAFPMDSDEIPSEKRSKHLLLIELQKLLYNERSSLSEVNLPEIDKKDVRVDDILKKERSRVSVPSLMSDIAKLSQLNTQQRAVYDKVQELLANPIPANNVIYVNAEAGTGKTFMGSVIAASARLDGNIVAAAATSGLAALNLVCGTTLHKCFELPVVENGEVVISRLSPMSHQGVVLFHATLILLDEMPTTSLPNFAAIDVMLQELMENTFPFGGKVVLCVGDFNQMPPDPKRAPPTMNDIPSAIGKTGPVNSKSQVAPKKRGAVDSDAEAQAPSKET